MIYSFLIIMTILVCMYIFYKMLTSNFITWRSDKDIVRLIGDMRWRLDWAIAAVSFTFIIKESVRAVIYYHADQETNKFLFIASILFTLSLYWLAGEIHAESRWRKQLKRKSVEIERLVEDKKELDKQLLASKEKLEVATRNLETIKEGMDNDSSIYQLAEGE